MNASLLAACISATLSSHFFGLFGFFSFLFFFLHYEVLKLPSLDAVEGGDAFSLNLSILCRCCPRLSRLSSVVGVVGFFPVLPSNKTEPNQTLGNMSVRQFGIFLNPGWRGAGLSIG